MRESTRFLLLTLAGEKGTQINGILMQILNAILMELFLGEKEVTRTLRFPKKNHSKKL